jgi:hypothetical protein
MPGRRDRRRRRVLINRHVRVTPDTPIRGVIRRDRKLFCIDLAALVPKRAKYFQDDLHPNDAGADLISDIISGELIKARRASLKK